MSDAETRALVRAALMLLLVSLVRWGWGGRGAPEAPLSGSVLEELTTRSEAMAEDQAIRTRPLAPGERLDPNRADARELDRLPGVGPATAEAIVEARRSGGPFVAAEDLTRVRGIGPATVARLAPHLEVARPPPATRAPNPTSRHSGPAPAIDVNRADSEALQGLPGVGPVLARRIVAVREQAPFRTVDDLMRVPGIGPATLERLRDRVTVGR